MWRKTNVKHKLEKMAINDALPLKTTGRDAIAKLKLLLGFRIWAVDKPDADSFRFAVRRHANLAYSVCDGLGTEQNTEGR